MDKRANTLEQLGELFKQNPAPYLAAGAGALAGGGLTMLKKREEGESRMGRLGRILANAAIVGGAAGGGTALMQKGIQGFQNALPEGDISAPEAAGNLLTEPKVYSALAAAGIPGLNYARQLKADKKGLAAVIGDKLKEPALNLDSYAQTAAKDATKGMTSDKAIWNRFQKELVSGRLRDHQTAHGAGLRAAEVDTMTRRGIERKLQGTGELDSIKNRFRDFGFDPDLKGGKRFAAKHLDRIIGRSTGSRLMRGGVYGAAIAAPFAVAPGLRKAFQGPDPSIYEQ